MWTRREHELGHRIGAVAIPAHRETRSTSVFAYLIAHPTAADSDRDVADQYTTS
jgi:hypothetical protein